MLTSQSTLPWGGAPSCVRSRPQRCCTAFMAGMYAATPIHGLAYDAGCVMKV